MQALRSKVKISHVQEVIVTNTIPVAAENQFPCLTVLSVANLLGETVRESKLISLFE